MVIATLSFFDVSPFECDSFEGAKDATTCLGSELIDGLIGVNADLMTGLLCIDWTGFGVVIL